MMRIQIKRAYDPPDPNDGYRILVDRLWPRGLKKADAAIDDWVKDIAPSTELRKWFGHDEAKFEEFTRRYRAELRGSETKGRQLITETQGRTMTLVFGASDAERNNAVVLKDWLYGIERKGRSSPAEDS